MNVYSAVGVFRDPLQERRERNFFYQVSANSMEEAADKLCLVWPQGMEFVTSYIFSEKPTIWPFFPYEPKAPPAWTWRRE